MFPSMEASWKLHPLRTKREKTFLDFIFYFSLLYFIDACTHTCTYRYTHHARLSLPLPLPLLFPLPLALALSLSLPSPSPSLSQKRGLEENGYKAGYCMFQNQ